MKLEESKFRKTVQVILRLLISLDHYTTGVIIFFLKVLPNSIIPHCYMRWLYNVKYVRLRHLYRAFVIIAVVFPVMYILSTCFELKYSEKDGRLDLYYYSPWKSSTGAKNSSGGSRRNPWITAPIKIARPEIYNQFATRSGDEPMHKQIILTIHGLYVQDTKKHTLRDVAELLVRQLQHLLKTQKKATRIDILISENFMDQLNEIEVETQKSVWDDLISKNSDRLFLQPLDVFGTSSQMFEPFYRHYSNIPMQIESLFLQTLVCNSRFYKSIILLRSSNRFDRPPK